jgi:hypothetical protein
MKRLLTTPLQIVSEYKMLLAVFQAFITSSSNITFVSGADPSNHLCSISSALFLSSANFSHCIELA